MNKLRKLSSSKPILYCILSLIVFLITLYGLKYLFSYLFYSKVALRNSFLLDVLVEMVALFIAVLFIKGADQDYVLKCSKGSFGTGLICGGYVITVCGISIFFNFLSLTLVSEFNEEILSEMVVFRPFYVIILFIVYMALIGFAEEFLFRGVISERLLRIYGKDSTGVKKAIVISSIIFGSIHLLNGISTGLESSIVQAIVATFLGMILCTTYYKSGNIYSVAFIHALQDFTAFAFNGGIIGDPNTDSALVNASTYSIINLTAVIPYIIVLFVIMRKKNIDIILNRIGIETENEN